MNLTALDFELPPEQVARFPASRREESRLLLLDRASGNISHHRFHELPGLLPDRALLVFNNTRVLQARFFAAIGARPVEFLCLRSTEPDCAEVLASPARAFRLGAVVELGLEIRAEVLAVGPRGRRTLRFNRPLNEAMTKLGFPPLPPYLKRKREEALLYAELDRERYQTVYASLPGAVAAPTAGLHFSAALLEEIRKRHEIQEITLHVGEATFKPIEVDKLEDHQLDEERVLIPTRTGQRLHQARKEGKSLLAVGTTVVRALESYAGRPAGEEAFASDLFIKPGHVFTLCDHLLTNFHLPRSTLLALVSAFAGHRQVMTAYKTALAEGYRFFSYGDAMLIL